MNLSFSLAFNSSFPHIERNGIGFETFVGSFALSMPFSFHNHMVGPFLGLHRTLVGDTLYCITGHPTSSTKNQNKCISI
jgi:hypothetical protein